jgi:hypothetical protein
VIVGAVCCADAEHGVPIFRGARAHRALVRLFGLPNAAPTSDEWARLGPLACVATRRLVFVDDWSNGEPRAVWLPGEPTRSGRGRA